MAIDIPEIVRHAAAPGPTFLATVVRTDGPCYRKIGARLLVGELGRLAGAVSGGCVERALVRRIGWLTREGPRVETYDTAADGDETDLSYLGCGGSIDVLLQRVEPDLLRLLERVAARPGATCIATVVATADPTVAVGSCWSPIGPGAEPGQKRAPWAARCESLADECLRDRCHLLRQVDAGGGAVSVLVEYVPPPRRLLVAARHYDAAPVVSVARHAGWHVTLATTGDADDLGTPDRRIGLGEGDIRAWCRANRGGAMVIMTHSVAVDRECLGAALREDGPGYVAVLGPASRTASLVEALDADGGAPEGAIARLRSPAGLALGGEGAGAIAISFVAELEQRFARRIPVR